LCNIFVHFARRPDLCFNELKRQSKTAPRFSALKCESFC
jgi:hypothetical protein